MSLDATSFKYNELYNSKQFEIILEQIEVCCKRMVERSNPVKNDENIIRNVLYKDYLSNNIVREELNLNQFIFSIETPELDDEYHESGRHDIRIMNPVEYCRSTDLYYVVECKRLESYSSGKGSLNWKYINEGVQRFVSRIDYPSIYGKSAMIGFLINNLNLYDLVVVLNAILKKETDIPTSQFIIKTDSIPASNCTYLSIHTDLQKSSFHLYHLLVDFSKIIQKN